MARMLRAHCCALHSEKPTCTASSWRYSRSTRAIRTYEKAGFKLEGVRKQALFREGAWHDEHIMAILREEWDALNRKA